MRYCSLVLLFLLLTSCGNPMQSYYKEIKKMGFIPYTVPESNTGIGTLFSGSINMHAPSEYCLENTNLEDLIIRVPYLTPGNDKSKPLEVTIGFKVSFNYKILLKMHGVQIEYIDPDDLSSIYHSDFSERCKNSLNRYGMVVSALKVDRLEYSFYREVIFGASAGLNKPVKLTKRKVRALLGAELELDYKIIDRTTLLIDTPTYVGMVLGKLPTINNGVLSEISYRKLGNSYKFIRQDLDKYIESITEEK